MATFQHFPTPLYPFAPPPSHVVPPPPPFHPVAPPPPRVLPPPPPFHPVAPPPPRVLPPPPPFHPIAPPPPRVLPPPPPFHPIAPPPPSVLPPPPPFHPIAPPPPHVFPPPSPDNGSTVVVVVFIAFGGFFFAAFCCFALWCFIKRRKERKIINETDIIRTDEHIRVKEAIVQGPNGPEVVVLSIEDDKHIQEEIIKNEKLETMHLHGKTKSGENIAATDHHHEKS